MRSALLFLALLASAAAQAQTNAETGSDSCLYAECALRVEPAATFLGIPSLIPRIVRVSADTTVAGGPGRPLAPVVASSSQALGLARRYDRSRAVTRVLNVVGIVLLAAWVVDDIGLDYLSPEAEFGVLTSGVVAAGVTIPLSLRSRRRATAAVEAYNASLNR